MFVKNLSKIAVVAAFAGVVSVSAQNATAQDVNVVTANFQQAGLIPSFLPSLSPQGVLEVAFNGTQINIGEPQTQDAVGAFPNIQINPLTGSSAWGFGDNFTYTALMADADIVGTSGSTPQTFHWLANGLTLGSSSLDPPFSLNLTTATTIINYAGPGPFAGSGAHRYVIMLVRQYSNFTAPSGLNSPNTPLGTHSTSQYLSTTGLGSIVAASYFTVENGQATVTVSSTSAVDVATVATVLSTSAASSMGSASMTGSRSGSASSVASTGSRTGAATGAASSAAASSGAAMAGKAIGGNWVVAGVTVVGVFFGALMI